MTAPTNILHVIYSLDPREGGMSEGLRQICNAHARLEQAFEIATMDAPFAPWLESVPGRVHAFGPVSSRFGYNRNLRPWLDQNVLRFTSVVIHGLWQFHGLATHRALRGTGVPYYVFPHGMLDPWFKRAHPLKHLKKALYWKLLERRVLEDANGILFTTDDEARLAPQSFPLGKCKSLTVGFGIDTPAGVDRVSAENFVSRWPECKDKRLMLFLSRIHEKKGCDLLIDGFAKAAQRDERLHLVIAGPDEQGLKAQLEAQAKRLGIATRITWTGMLTGDDKWSALKAAEVFALFSHQENFGVAVVEALAIGLPVLVTHPVNIASAVVAKGAGFADEDTQVGAARLIHRWLDTSTSEREDMRARAVACFKALFHSDATTQRLVQAIHANHPLSAAS